MCIDIKPFILHIMLCVSLFALPNNIDELRQMYLGDPSGWEAPFVDSDAVFSEIGALPQDPPYPESNPFSKEKVKLGEMLFYDPKLSQSAQIACASCHDKDLGFADGRKVSYGHDRQQGRRNAPSVVMSAFGKEKFWDGRAENLESQSLMPIADPVEMAHSLEDMLERIRSIDSYKIAFETAFGDSEITLERIAMSLATYERSLMPKNNRFDKFLRGNSSAMSDLEVWGLHLFRTKARCINCHNGVAFSDQQYHNLGLSWYGRKKYEDLGRYEVTKLPEDVGKFKTPSLRQVSQTAPYMHNGLFPTLRNVINAYNAGMADLKPTKEQENDPLFPRQKSNLLRKLDLSNEEIEALEAFLRTL